jgi:hypothetical protein
MAFWSDIRQMLDEIGQLQIAKSFSRFGSLSNESGLHVRQ